MRFDLITIFPNIFDSYFSESILKKAQQKKLVKIFVHNLRDFTNDKHRTVDDKPYGGGVGMVLMVEPIHRAVKKIKQKNKKTRVILLSAKGKTLNQKKVKSLVKYDQLILICGRYEGVDERVAKYIAQADANYGATKEQVKETSNNFFELLSSLQFLPNSPCLMNADTPKPQLSSSVHIPLKDELTSIFAAMTQGAHVHQSGAG